MSKKEVGLYATMCLLKEKAPTFMSVRQELHKGVSLRKGEDWVSELQVLQEFTNRLDLHLASGKVMWRADPWTANGWQYQDQWQHKEDHLLAKESNLSSPVPLVWSQIQEQYRTKKTQARLTNLKLSMICVVARPHQDWTILACKGAVSPAARAQDDSRSKKKGTTSTWSLHCHQ